MPVWQFTRFETATVGARRVEIWASPGIRETHTFEADEEYKAYGQFYEKFPRDTKVQVKHPDGRITDHQLHVSYYPCGGDDVAKRIREMLDALGLTSVKVTVLPEDEILSICEESSWDLTQGAVLNDQIALCSHECGGRKKACVAYALFGKEEDGKWSREPILANDDGSWRCRTPSGASMGINNAVSLAVKHLTRYALHTGQRLAPKKRRAKSPG
jgi:hypothetical protein